MSPVSPNAQGGPFLRDYLKQITDAFPVGESNKGADDLRFVIRTLLRTIYPQKEDAGLLSRIKKSRIAAARLLVTLLEQEKDAFVGWKSLTRPQNEQQRLATVLRAAIGTFDRTAYEMEKH